MYGGEGRYSQDHAGSLLACAAAKLIAFKKKNISFVSRRTQKW